MAFFVEDGLVVISLTNRNLETFYVFGMGTPSQEELEFCRLYCMILSLSAVCLLSSVNFLLRVDVVELGFVFAITVEML